MPFVPLVFLNNAAGDALAGVACGLRFVIIRIRMDDDSVTDN